MRGALALGGWAVLIASNMNIILRVGWLAGVMAVGGLALTGQWFIGKVGK